MELIPVFSLIVLVATVATFILAVGAYVMFRIRESSGRSRRLAMPETYEADVFAPQPVDSPPSAATVQTAARRESLKDPHVVRMTPNTIATGEPGSQEEGRRWQ